MKKVATILLIATLIVFVAACTSDSVSNDVQSTLTSIVCGNCAASISSEVKYCPECGTKITPDEGNGFIETQNPQKSTENSQIEETKETNSSRFFVPTKNGAGLEFPLPDCIKSTALQKDVTYFGNRMLYAVGCLAGEFSLEENFEYIALSSYSYNEGMHAEDGSVCAMSIELEYETITVCGDYIYISIDAGVNGSSIDKLTDSILAVNGELSIEGSKYSYSSYDGLDVYRHNKGSWDHSAWVNIDTGEWTEEIRVEIEETTTPDSTQMIWPNSANYSWNNIANAGIGIGCDESDNWYSYGGSDIAVWVASEKKWLSEVTIILQPYLIVSEDGINYYVYDVVDGKYVKQWGFAYHMTPNGLKGGHVELG